jgi:hypothetical protein
MDLLYADHWQATDTVLVECEKVNISTLVLTQ